METSAPPPAVEILYPLVVDLDGTLLKTDSLWELLVRLIARKPWTILFWPIWLLQGRATFKEKVAVLQSWHSVQAPINGPLVDYLCSQHRLGRTLVLATAAHHSIAHAIASRFQMFSTVLATDSAVNLKGSKKLEAIHRSVGEEFAYAGNSRADFPIWREAKAAVVVSNSRRIVKRVAKITQLERHFSDRRAGLKEWARAIRVHQWAKNVLVFVPLFTSFAFFDPASVWRSIVCFIAFNAVASGSYLLNDLLDLDHDRLHPRKQHRPLASGSIGIPAGAAASLALMAGGFLAMALTGMHATALLGLYVSLTLIYSVKLKRYMIADVVTLASLYTLRIVVGAYAIEVPLSQWLLSFSSLLFFGLALAKRCNELAMLDEMQTTKATPGRDYMTGDLRVLWPMGLAAGFSSVVVLELFLVYHISPGSADARHSWIVSTLLLYWLTRLWVKISRRQMDDDPVVFALRDRGSRVIVCAMVLAYVLVRFYDGG